MNFHDRSDFEWRAKRSRIRLRVFLLLFLLLQLVPPCSIVGEWLRGKARGRSVSRFSARRSVTFPRIKFESIFLSVILVTPAYNNVGGKRSLSGREREDRSSSLDNPLSLSLLIRAKTCPFPRLRFGGKAREVKGKCRGDSWFIRGSSCAPTLPPATPRESRSFLMARARWPRCSREKWTGERERERSCVALIEAGEKQVYENRKRYCNRARKLPERDESSSFSRDVFSRETIDGILRNTENRSLSPKMNIRISWKVETFVVSNV